MKQQRRKFLKDASKVAVAAVAAPYVMRGYAADA